MTLKQLLIRGGVLTVRKSNTMFIGYYNESVVSTSPAYSTPDSWRAWSSEDQARYDAKQQRRKERNIRNSEKQK